MKKFSLLFLAICFCNIIIGQDWNGIPVPANPGVDKIWELQENVSDDFNYVSPPNAAQITIGEKWTNRYHNDWTGPLPTVWKGDHVFVEDGSFQVIASRPPGEFVEINGSDYPITNMGCATSLSQVQYPVYIETNVKIMNAVLASNVWILSSDDTQEIDICEAYGSNRWTNPFFDQERLHLSHHVFIREPFTDWQPNDEGSFYTDGSTIWREAYHRIGVYWIDPWNLEYYVDGQLVRTRSGPDEIDPLFHTNAIDPGDSTTDTRTGLSKPMDIILNAEDQTWRAVDGLSPTDGELANTENHTFKIDWIRVYKPIDGCQNSVAGQPGSVTYEINQGTNLTQGQNMSIGGDIIPPVGEVATQIEIKYQVFNVDWEFIYSDEGTIIPISANTFTASHTIGAEAIISSPTNTNTFIQAVVSFSDGSCTYSNVFVQMSLAPLPVELNFFKAESSLKTNILKWQVLSEIDNSHFDIERSVNGFVFSPIGRVAGQGRIAEVVNYQFIDETPLTKGYYRLKQVDNDGRIDFTSIVFVDRSQIAIDELNLFPIPAKDALIVAFHSAISEDVIIEINDLNGRVIYNHNFAVQVGENHVNISCLSIPSGTYFLRLKSNYLELNKLFLKQ